MPDDDLLDDSSVDTDNDEVKDLMDEYELDENEAEDVKDIMDEEGLDAEEAMEVKELGLDSKSGGRSWLMWLIIIGLIVYWANHSLPNKDSSGNDVPTPVFDSQKEAAKNHQPYSETRSIQACSDSGCYRLSAEIEHSFIDNVDHAYVDTVYFDNGGYLTMGGVEIGSCGDDQSGKQWCFGW